MSKAEIKMPKITDDMEEGVIVTTFKQAGDTVEADELVFEIVVGKMNGDIVSPIKGTVKEILVEEGAIVPVDKVMAIIEG